MSSEDEPLENPLAKETEVDWTYGSNFTFPAMFNNSFYSGNTTNLAYHIRKHHREHLKDIKESETKRKDDSETSDTGLKHL